MTDTFERDGVTWREGSVLQAVIATWRYGHSYRNSLEICEAIGIDPDMSLVDLEIALLDFQLGSERQRQETAAEPKHTLSTDELDDWERRMRRD